MTEMHTICVEYNGGDNTAVLEYEADRYTVEESFDMAESEVQTAYGPNSDITSVTLED